MLLYSLKFFQQRGLSLVTSRSRDSDLTMKLFPAKITERATLQKSMTSESNSTNVDRRPPLQRGLMNFQLLNSKLYNKLLLSNLLYRDQYLKILVPWETVSFVSLEPKC